MAETPNELITMGFDPDLDDAAVIALRNMIKLICSRTGLSREMPTRCAAWRPICA
jgi:acetamidase/formamidase